MFSQQMLSLNEQFNNNFFLKKGNEVMISRVYSARWLPSHCNFFSSMFSIFHSLKLVSPKGRHY